MFILTLITSYVHLIGYLISYRLVRLLILLIAFQNHFFESPLEAQQTTYDYIIVGAGTAGISIFNDLSPELDVLMIEAGISITDDHWWRSLLHIPIITPALQRSTFDWSYLTEPQTNACRAMKGKRCRLAAGRGYGGSNILNNMIYHRGDKNDYRGWFSDPYDYNYDRDILPLFRKIEEKLMPIEIPHKTRLAHTFADFKASNIEFTLPKVLQINGLRSFTSSFASSSTSRHHNGRHEILFNAHATKLIFTDSPSNSNRIASLEFMKNNKLYRVHAKQGYILTSGAIGTPKLLLQSGIGSCNDLAKSFVQCHHNLPGVGRNLQDHIAIGFDLIALNTTLDLTLVDLLHPKTVYQFFVGSGNTSSQWSTVGCDAIGYVKSNRSDLSPTLGFMILPMGLTSDGGACLRNNLNINDNIWYKYFNRLKQHQQHTTIISILPIVLQPKSRGHITIVSNDAQTPPIINPKYLSHPNDRQLLIDGIKLIRNQILMHPQLKKLNATFISDPLPACISQYQYDSDNYWQCYVKYLSFSVYHLAGTCRIGDLHDQQTVVDRASFRVRGLDNVYVADASIMPNMPSGNTNAAVALIAKQFIKVLTNNNKCLNANEQECDRLRAVTKEKSSPHTHDDL